jgi:hypothetical protein
MEKITFIQDDNTAIEFYVLEKTIINEREYLLVTDQEEGDAEALILKDMSESNSEEAMYQSITDDEELEVVAKIFENLLEDITFA